MDITAVLQGASRAPQLQPALNAAQRELGDVAPRQVEELIKLLETALARPEQYAEIRKAAIADDMVNAEDLPEQFDPQLVASLLVMLYRLREAPAPEVAMAGGGLARMRTLASRGRYGDTMLAHISPREAAMLRARGGAGTINPATGLPQFFSLKDFVRAALPIAATFIAPGLRTFCHPLTQSHGTWPCLSPERLPLKIPVHDVTHQLVDIVVRVSNGQQIERPAADLQPGV